MPDLLAALSHDFLQNAIAAGLLAAVACGVIGTLVVVNRLVFMAGGVAHTAYGGVGLAFFLGWPVLPTAVGFTAAASLGMAWATRRETSRADALIGVLWAAGMAFGVLLLDLTPGYNVDLMSYLFGSILAVSAADIWIMAGMNLVILGLTIFFYRDFLVLSFDREFARTRGVPVDRLHALLLLMIAVSVVMIIQVVGLILVIALLTIPARMAERRSNSMAEMMVRAVLLSVFFVLTGLALAYSLDLTSGATIIAVATLCFGLALLKDALLHWRRT